MALLSIIAAVYTVSSVSIAHAFHYNNPTVLHLTRPTRHGNAHRYDTLGNMVNKEQPPSSSPSSSASSSALKLSSSDSSTDFHSLMVMDVVLFQRQPKTNSNTKLELGAVQENGNIAPLSTWTLESAYTSPTHDMMEFVVDEDDMFPGLSSDQVKIVKFVEGVDYGSRQVGGGKGPGNPHGEESEMLYYVERGVVEGLHTNDVGVEDGVENNGLLMMIDVVVNPNLEILW